MRCENMSNLYIIAGEIGVGKTNFTINFAKNLAKTQKITLIDLDTSNLYFRLSELKDEIKCENINMILPQFANLTQEVPSLSGAVESALRDVTQTVIVDTPGGDFGITILSRYRDLIKARNAQILYVINKFRAGIETAEKAATTLKSFENATNLKVTNLINNSHLGNFTTIEDMQKSAEYAKSVSEICKINLLYNCVSENFAENVQARIENIFPIKIIGGGRL